MRELGRCLVLIHPAAELREPFIVHLKIKKMNGAEGCITWLNSSPQKLWKIALEFFLSFRYIFPCTILCTHIHINDKTEKTRNILSVGFPPGKFYKR